VSAPRAFDPRRAATQDPAAFRVAAIVVALGFLLVFVCLPVLVVLVEAFSRGVGPFVAALRDEDTVAAALLTLKVAAVAVPLNVTFGVAAAWAIARFRFPGRALLLSLLDLPLAVSPVIAGMIFVLLFGRQGALGPWLEANGLQIIFAEPGIILATVFVTFPYVARELVTFWESQGTEEEEAALVLGASGPTMFRRVALPGARWAIFYGVVLTNARAMGEFGAVSVVSGHIRGRTNTLPLHVEVLHGEYAFAQAFSVASLLLLLGVVTLVAKRLLEPRKSADRPAEPS
jgi:sulfate transport system permease protein